MVESADIPEVHHEHQHTFGDDDFRKLTGIYVGVVAMLLSITSLGGSNATKEMLSANIRASDAYAYYQAKYLRQTADEIAATQLETVLAAAGQMPPAARDKATAAIARYRATAAREESDKSTGRGKKELLAEAQRWEHRLARAEERDPNFAFAAALFQIAIVLGSVSIVAASRPLVRLSGLVAGLATLLMANGYFLLVDLPFGYLLQLL
ncbi:MAG TPA: DUF4337 domain-containing protein [Stellaceae bacterium]|nr:DUF4337 domain-containing protein [Stellaceae bacterium]